MRVRVVTSSQISHSTLPIIYITVDVEITAHLNCSIVTQFKETAGLVNEPKLAARRNRWFLPVGIAPTNNDTVFDVALLGHQQHLISRIWWADHSPAISDPLR